MKEATKRARVFLTWNLLDFLFRANDRRPYTRKELFQQSVEPSKMLDPEINKESRNTRWQTQILKTLQDRHIIELINEDGQTFYVLDRGAVARTVLEEWDDDNGMLVRALVFPGEVDFDAFFAKRVKEDNTEFSQVPLPPSQKQIDAKLAEIPEDDRPSEEALGEMRLADDEVEEILDRNVDTKDGRFVARLVLLLTRKYNGSIATLNGLLERMIDGMGGMKSEIGDMVQVTKALADEIGPRLSEVEKKTGGYNKRLETMDRHVVDVASAVRNASRQDTGRIVADLRQVLEPLLTQKNQQEPEAIATALADAMAETLTEVTKEIQKNTAMVEKVHAQQGERQKTLQLLAKSLEANVKEAETLRLLILEQCDGR